MFLPSAPVPIAFTVRPGEKTILMLTLALREVGERGYEVHTEGPGASPEFPAPTRQDVSIGDR